MTTLFKDLTLDSPIVETMINRKTKQLIPQLTLTVTPDDGIGCWFTVHHAETVIGRIAHAKDPFGGSEFPYIALRFIGDIDDPNQITDEIFTESMEDSIQTLARCYARRLASDWLESD